MAILLRLVTLFEPGTSVPSGQNGNILYLSNLTVRYDYFRQILERVIKSEGDLDCFSRGYEHFGFNVDPMDSSITYREWAPSAQAACLIGDFSKTNRWL